MKRTQYLEKISAQFRISPICASLGVRQVGKTTLARQFAEQQNQRVEIFYLENPNAKNTDGEKTLDVVTPEIRAELEKYINDQSEIKEPDVQ
jgi:predicted AAA+ superfamily ATPase